MFENCLKYFLKVCGRGRDGSREPVRKGKLKVVGFFLRTSGQEMLQNSYCTLLIYSGSFPIEIGLRGIKVVIKFLHVALTKRLIQSPLGILEEDKQI